MVVWGSNGFPARADCSSRSRFPKFHATNRFIVNFLGIAPRNARNTSGTLVTCGAAHQESLEGLDCSPSFQPAVSTTSTLQTQAVAAAGPYPTELLLSDIRVVLVSPKHEANIGAVARVCANFECLDLVLVAPRCAADGGDVRKVACGDAVLNRLRVFDTLADALADTVSSVGFTRRAGATRLTHASLGHLLAEFPWALPLQPLKLAVRGTGAAAAAPGVAPPPLNVAPGPLVAPGGASELQGPVARLGEAERHALVQHLETARLGITQQQQQFVGAAAAGSAGVVAGAGAGVTALVFGREESGLTEAELRLCSHACAIPTGRVQPSMNLSHATAVVLAELFSRRCGLLEVSSPGAVDAATAALGPNGNGDLLRLAVAERPPSSSGFSQPCPGGEGVAAERSTAGSRLEENEQGVVAETTGRETAAREVDRRLQDGSGSPSTSTAAPSAAGSVDAGLLPASPQELDLLVRKVAAVAEAVGMRGEEATGGGKKGNHGRRRLPVGHVRAVLSRARVNASESRSLHGLASAVLQQLNPDHPLEARKRLRKLPQAQGREQTEPAEDGAQRGKGLQ